MKGVALTEVLEFEEKFYSFVIRWIMTTPLEITKNELVGEPQLRNLANGKKIIAFNLKISDKTVNLNTGQKLRYQDDLYEIMNREPVQSTIDYLKFNCFLKAADEPFADS